MLLVFDIGNTNVCVGCFRGEELLFEMRLKTDHGRTYDESTAILDSLFTRKLGAAFKFDACIIASVVPPVTPDYIKLSREMLGIEPLVVGPGIKTGIALKVNEPTAVGADRVVNAVAAKTFFGTPSLVIDCGTATTLDIVDKEGNYQGGAICPGMRGAIDSLFATTAKLPRVELAWPKSVVGKTTVSAMQAGGVIGYVCMIDGLIEKTIAEMGSFSHIVATGGLGRLVAEHSTRITSYDAALTLKGLRVIAEMNL